MISINFQLFLACSIRSHPFQHGLRPSKPSQHAQTHHGNPKRVGLLSPSLRKGRVQVPGPSYNEPVIYIEQQVMLYHISRSQLPSWLWYWYTTIIIVNNDIYMTVYYHYDIVSVMVYKKKILWTMTKKLFYICQVSLFFIIFLTAFMIFIV
jgi:hypothetical protein